MINSYIIFGILGEIEKLENDIFRLVWGFPRSSLNSHNSRWFGVLQWYTYHSSAFWKPFHMKATCILRVVPLKFLSGGRCQCPDPLLPFGRNFSFSVFLLDRPCVQIWLCWKSCSILPICYYFNVEEEIVVPIFPERFHYVSYEDLDRSNEEFCLYKDSWFVSLNCRTSGYATSQDFSWMKNACYSASRHSRTCTVKITEFVDKCNPEN